MSNFLSELGGITAGVGAEGLAFAAGFAAGHALQPEADLIGQESWHAAQLRRLDPNSAAEAAAEGLADETTMADEASYSGLDSTRFAYLYDLALTAPGMGELLNMLRRTDEVPINFAHGLRKARLEPRWDDALRNLRDVRIPAPDLAYMVVRDLVPNPFSGSGPTGPRDDAIVDIPQLQIDTLKEAAKTGWDAQRFEALVGRSGLAPAPILAANAYFRGIITWEQYRTIIAKGDLRPAYTNVILNAAREILTAGQYSEAELRGYSTTKERQGNTAKHGMSIEDSNLLHLIQGRPLAVHQVTTGLARGGEYGGVYTDVPEPYQHAIRQSDIKEPWARLAYANRYTYPSGFQIRAEAQKGDLAFAETEQLLLEVGWSPKWAAFFAEKWTGGTAAVSDPHVTKAQNQLWTTTHSSYKAGEIDDATATTALGAAGVGAGAVPAVLDVWRTERALVRHGLTVANIHKAYTKQDENDATGLPWTRDEAIAKLVGLGYNPAEAGQYLDIV